MIYLRDYDRDYFTLLKGDIRSVSYLVSLIGTLSANDISSVKSSFKSAKVNYPQFSSGNEALFMEMKSTVVGYMDRSLQSASAESLTDKSNILSVDNILTYLMNNSSDGVVIATCAKMLNGDYLK